MAIAFAIFASTPAATAQGGVPPAPVQSPWKCVIEAPGGDATCEIGFRGNCLAGSVTILKAKVANPDPDDEDDWEAFTAYTLADEGTSRIQITFTFAPAANQHFLVTGLGSNSNPDPDPETDWQD